MPFRRRYRRKRAFGRPFKRRRLNIRRKGRKTRIKNKIKRSSIDAGFSYG